MKSIFILVLTFISLHVISQDYSKAFKNWAWGTILEENSEKFTKSENNVPPLKAYDYVDEDFSFEGITAEMITYGFKRSELKGVNILIKDEYLNQLVQKWTEKYGDPKFTDAGFLKNYEWNKDDFRLTISHFPEKEGDANTTIGIMKK